MNPDGHELRDSVSRMLQFQAEQASFNKDVTAALTTIVERLDEMQQRLEQFSRAIQPRAVNTPFARRPGDSASALQITDNDPPE